MKTIHKQLVFGKAATGMNAYPCIHGDGTPAVIYQKTLKVAKRIAAAHGLKILVGAADRIADRISKSRPYGEAAPETPLDGINTSNTAQRIINSFALDLEVMCSGACELNNGKSMAHVCEMIATGLKRCDDIGESLTLRLSFESAKVATEAIYRRRNRFAKWEVLPAEYDMLLEASEAMAAIIMASSPEQMKQACMACDDYWNRAKDLR